jgi:competence protein ComEC
MGGLSDVVHNLSVGQAIVGHSPVSDPEYGQFSRAVHKEGIPLSTVSARERFEIDGVSIEVLWPPRDTGSQVTSGNDDSVVLRLVYGSVSILLAGDIERAAEGSLVASGTDMRADILKVPHHGSRTSSTEAFIHAVNPTYAVISVGERSRFGHPHRVVVDRYVAHNVKLFQTGRDGMVTVTTDGSSLTVGTFRQLDWPKF